MLTRPGTIVLGSAGFPASVASALNRAGARASLASGGRRLGRQIERASAVVVPTDDPEPLSQWLDLLGRHPARGTQQRVAVGWDATPPAALAAADSTIRYRALPQVAARLLLNRWPLHFSADVAAGEAPQLLLLGFNRRLRAVLLQAMRVGHYGAGPLRVDVLCAAPQDAKRWFDAAYPQAGAFCRVAFHPLTGHTALRQGRPTGAYVGLEDDARTLAASEHLAALLDRHGLSATPIYLLLTGTPAAAGVESWDGRRYPFTVIDEVCRPPVLFGTARDRLARIIHDHYQDTIASQARDPATAPAAVSWDALDESYRDASRNQGDHAAAKLALVRCSASHDTGAFPFVFRRRQVEQLARVEHDRWAADRWLDGWTHGAERDNTTKKHPDLVPFDELPVPVQDLDRFAVRLLPALLGRQDLGVKPQLRVLLWLANDSPRRAMAGLADPLFERLAERFLSHQPVLLTRLANAAERAFASRAAERHDIPLRVLIPGQAARGERREASYLRLLARAEARLALTDPAPSTGWVEQSSDLVFADDISLSRWFQDTRPPQRRLIELSAGRLVSWHFEY